ncbi:hypothetical protein B0I35DRAFT_94111 [Stachybotrys elegans]|uniref:Uncharacterized protein n=1 Tax=Stachybotrys elegans TaxID=80388 RepID=A0A8K0SMY6_9HYPO|nr:hypothetical protein B0I35DRAFT_94111 [Stachybotrys elegans]
MGNVIAFFQLQQANDASNQQEPDFCQFRIDLDILGCRPDHQRAPRPNILQDNGIRLCFRPYCQRCDFKNSLHFVHTTCLQLAQRVMTDFATRDLFSITAMGRPMVWSRSTATFMNPRFDSTALGLLVKYAGDTDLGKLVSDINKRVPLELETMIYRSVSGPLRSFLHCLTNVSAYQACGQRSINIYSPTTTYFPFRDCDGFDSIQVKLVKILGENCIGEISALNHGAERNETITTASASTVIAVQVSLGYYGLTAIRYLLQGGGASAWAGSPQHEWITTYPIQDPRQLQVVSDGFKVVQVKVATGSASVPLPPDDRTQIFWDQPPEAAFRKDIALSILQI